MTAKTNNPPYEAWEEDAISRLPGSLCKSLTDDWNYTVGLRDGRIIQFSRARLDSRHWLELFEPRAMRGFGPVQIAAERRVYVRIDQICWCTETDS